MLELSANLEFLFGDRDFADRVDATADLGMKACEFGEWRSRDMPEIIRRVDRHGLVVANLSVDPRVRLLDGDQTDAFVEAVRTSSRVAQEVGCTRLGVVVEPVNVMPGQPWHEYQRKPEQRDVRRNQRTHVVAALKKAAPIAQGEGTLLVLECLNTLVDHAGYFLTSWQEGVNIVREVDNPAVGLTFDTYHHQVNEGNLISSLTRDIDVVRHIHIADVPGRHEPGTGEIHFLNLLTAARRVGYDGYLGLECVPTTADAKASLHPIMDIVEKVNREVVAVGTR